jgi:hypothetical protein
MVSQSIVPEGEDQGVTASPPGRQPSGPQPATPSSQSGIPNAAYAEYAVYRSLAAEAVKPVVAKLPIGERAFVECYANAEYWSGWNAAIMMAAIVAEGRHSAWQESTLGTSAPGDDISACEDIAAAIRYQLHRKPCVSRPAPTTGDGDAQSQPS